MQMDTIANNHAGSLAESAILEQLRSAPAAATELRKRLGLKAAQLKLVLDALVAARKIHGRPRLGKNGKPTKAIETYAVGAPPPPLPSPRELAPNEILAQLGASELSPAELESRLDQRIGKLAAKDLKSVLAELLGAKRIFPIYKRDKNGKPQKTIERYTLQSPPPDDFVHPILDLWRQSRAAAAAAGVDDQAFVAALLRGLAQEGVRVDAAARAADPTEDQRAVMQAVRELVRREGHGALIAMRKLRAALRLPKDRFDGAVLRLYADDAVILHHHDYVGSLTDTERSELVVDSHGNYYVGVALRGEP